MVKIFIVLSHRITCGVTTVNWKPDGIEIERATTSNKVHSAANDRLADTLLLFLI